MYSVKYSSAGVHNAESADNNQWTGQQVAEQ